MATASIEKRNSALVDVNCDGKVTMSDVQKVFNRYFDPSYDLNCCCELL